MVSPGLGDGRDELPGAGPSEMLARELRFRSQSASKALVPVPIALGQGFQSDPRRNLSVPVGTVAQFQKEVKGGTNVLIQQVVKDCSETASLLSDCGEASNFPKLGLGIGIGSLSPSKVPVSGPSKRARPVETLSKRMSSRNSKGKGKASLLGKGGVKAAFTFGASLVADPGSGACLTMGPRRPGSSRGRPGDMHS